jgi:hypothetical protein
VPDDNDLEKARESMILQLGEEGAEETPAEATKTPEPVPVEDAEAKAKIEAEKAATDKAAKAKEAEDSATRLKDQAKALQDAQQRITSMERKLDENGSLTEKEKANLARAKEITARLDGILKEDYAGDPDVQVLAQRLKDVEAENASYKALQKAREEQDAADTADKAAWSEARTKYDGVKVEEVWPKAIAYAVEALGEDAPKAMLERLARKTFHDRCADAKASLDAKNKGKDPDPPTRPPQAKTEKPPSGPPLNAPIPGGASPSAMSIDDVQVQMIEQLLAY